MVQRNELLEYALVYGDYKGIPKQQVYTNILLLSNVNSLIANNYFSHIELLY